MRAKFINENIANVLKPKTKEEIDDVYVKEFVKKNGMTPDQVQKVVDELQELKVDARLMNRLSNGHISDSPIKISPYQIMDGNRVVAESPTKELAEKMRMAFMNFTFDTRDVKINKEDGGIGGYYSVAKAKRLINKLSLGITTTMINDKHSNLYNKYDNEGYWDWEVERRKKDK